LPLEVSQPTLVDLGWDDGWQAALKASPDPRLLPGRVSRIDLGLCTVLGATGTSRVVTDRRLDVAVGDWVTVAPGDHSDDRPRVSGVLPRRGAVRRAAEGGRVAEQVVAANIDTIFVVITLDFDLSLRRLERLLAVSWQSGATPVVLLTKADLVDEAVMAERVSAARSAAPGVAVHPLSVRTEQGMAALSAYLVTGRTVALLGMSGAGKSTLVNRLARRSILATGEVRADGKGRHTTTYRQLVALADGGLLIDTPGIRAVSLWDAADGVDRTFADIGALAPGCRFSDCSHSAEPGCAVLAAVRTGQLSADRLDSWQGLGREMDEQAVRKTEQTRADDRKQKRQRSRGGSRRMPPPGPADE
jgi:ribosome biogenesis GTPase